MSLNKENKIEMVQEIAEVRRTGLTNMFDRNSVIDMLYTMGYDYTAEYLEENKREYMDLLKMSGSY